MKKPGPATPKQATLLDARDRRAPDAAARSPAQTSSNRAFRSAARREAIVAVIWQSLFSKHAPLDANEMFRVHLDLIFGERRAA